jgi:DNA modification methylase
VKSSQASALKLKIKYRPLGDLRPWERNPRTHSPKQLTLLEASITKFGFLTPILIDAEGRIVAGEGRWLAAKLQGLEQIPTIQLDHLTDAERRAYVIADNRLAELSGWDRDLLRLELGALIELEPELEIEFTGFSTSEIDDILELPGSMIDPKADRIPEFQSQAISRLGDLWLLGEHRLLVGDARDGASYDELMAGERATMIFTDPPYNVKINGHAGGMGKAERREFAMASGEMSCDEFTRFLADALQQMAAFSSDGSIAFVCIDWRHLVELINAGKLAFDELKNVIVWAKTNAGMGSFYRSQHEHIVVFKKGKAPHINNFGLGDGGRYRTNLWTYPGVNSFGRERDAELALHPTVKPTALISDAIRDVTRRGDIVLDGFGGSGSTLISAERTGRRARLIELDTLYADVICRRWQAFSKKPAVSSAGATFDEIEADRISQFEPPSAREPDQREAA